MAEISPTKNRVLRSDMELDMQCHILWMSAFLALGFISSGQVNLESHVVAATALIVIGIPIVTLGVMKLVQLMGIAFMKRSKRVDFVDDVKGPTLVRERLPAVGIHRVDSPRDFEVSRGLGNLLLMLALYTVIVLLGFMYQSTIYFYVAAVVSAFLVAFGVFSLVALKLAKREKPLRGESLNANDKERELTPIIEDSHISWVVNSKSNTQVRISRTWLVTQLFHFGIWVPLILVLPLLGPMFGEMLWAAVALGVVYVFILEFCSVFSIGYLTSRVLGPQ